MATITELPKTSLTFEQKLDRLAQVAVNVGLGLEHGQELVMTATLDALPLARLITEQAYKAGASLVTTLFTDEQSTLARYRYADEPVSTQLPDGSSREWHRHSAAGRRGLRSPAEIPLCCRRKIRKK